MAEHLIWRVSRLNLNRISIPGLDAGIILAAFPGRTSANEFSAEEMQLVFDYFEDQHCHYLVSLIQDHEFGDFCGKSRFQDEASGRPFTWLHLPIVDMDIPDDKVIAELTDLRPHFLESLSSGNSIAIHCKGGLGRSGTIAAMILVDLGIAPKDAIDHIRSFRPGAIETNIQENFIASINPLVMKSKNN